MKKLLLLIITALTMTATGVWAIEDAPKGHPQPAAHEGAGAPGGKEWTLEEARKKAHEYADKLDKMTEADWAEHQQRRRAFKEKIKGMTPEQRKEFFQKQRENRDEKHEGKGGGASGAPGTAKPADGK